MIIEVAGVQYGDFVSANAEIRLDALSNTFSFQATSKDAVPLPFRGGEACKIFVDGDQVLSGFIEVVNVSGDARSHSIAIQGRDKTGDLLDSSVGPLGSFSGTVSLKSLCERVIKHVGTDVSVVDEATPEPFNAAEDLADPEPGDNAFAFLEQYARKRQVLLSSTSDGDLLIATSSGEEIDASIINRLNDPFGLNNVLKYTVAYDSTGRFNLYRTISQLNPSVATEAGELDALSIASQGDNASVLDEAIRRGRQHVLVSEAMTSSEPSKNRSLWEANIRKARGRTYGCTVNGYRNETGALWSVNKLPIVLDENAGIAARMLVNTVAFSLTRDGGRSTTLTFLERNAYTLQLQEPVTEEVGDDHALF